MYRVEDGPLRLDDSPLEPGFLRPKSETPVEVDESSLKVVEGVQGFGLAVQGADLDLVVDHTVRGLV